MSKVKTAAVSISSNGSSTTSFFLDEWCEEHLHNFCILGVHALTGSCSLAQASFARYDGCCLPSTKLSLGVLYVHCILFTYHVQDDLHHVSDVLSSKTSSLLGTEEILWCLWSLASPQENVQWDGPEEESLLKLWGGGENFSTHCGGWQTPSLCKLLVCFSQKSHHGGLRARSQDTY